MNTINIKLYDTLRKELNLSQEKNRVITLAIEETMLDEIGSNDKEVATKDFVKREISEAKNDLIKWMFTFGIGTIGIAILFFFLEK